MIGAIKDKHQWDDFVSKHGPVSGAFLNSWGYGDLENANGKQIERLGLYRDDILEGIALISYTSLPLGIRYGSILRGPVLLPTVLEQEALTSISEFVSGLTFIRFEPLREPPVGAKKTIHVSPPQTLLLDLSKTEDEILSDMHSKTRYNVRLSEKKGVVVRDLKESDYEAAWAIFLDTAERDDFRLHARSKYEALIEYLGARLVGGFLDGELLAVNLMVDFAGTRTYLHGASSNKHRNVMAPYAIHWSEIQNAKAAGLSTYDFWGISDDVPAWKGITRFKRGFGGREVSYPGTFDLPLSGPRYKLYKILRRIRRM